jgi:hypothetical protein
VVLCRDCDVNMALGLKRGRAPWHVLVFGISLLGLILSGCAESVTTQVVPVAQPLPQQEEARYFVLDGEGNQQGTAVLRITPEGEQARLSLEYDFGPGKTDNGMAIVRRESIRPVRSERTVIDGDERYVSRATYNGKVSVEIDDGKRVRTREAEISESSYDNISALFLWRVLDHSVGTEVRYVNVVVDPKRGTISRALGTAEVIGREEVRLPSGTVQAWRVEFRSAGITNTAWYRADASRALVRYEIARGPVLVLDSVSQ